MSTFNPKNFGAITDNSIDDTVAIKKAIDVVLESTTSTTPSDHRYTPIFRFTCHVFRFVSFMAVGFGFTYLLSLSLGKMGLLIVLTTYIGQWVLPLVVCLLFLLVVAIAIESWR